MQVGTIGTWRVRRRGTVRSMCLLVLVCFLTVSCAEMMQQPGQAALLCGAGGAAVGAAAGAAAGRGDWKAILIGAGIGGILGATACFAIAEYRNQQVRGYEETRKATSYQPSQGDVVQITQYVLTPAAAAPGSEVAFNATYSVMSPNPNQEVTVTETRTLKMYDPAQNGYKELGAAPSQVTVKPGTRQADGKFQVRSGVAEGRYLLVFQVATNGKSDTKELPFLVTKNTVELQAPSNRIAEVRAEGDKAVTPLSSLGESDSKAPKPPSTGSPAVATDPVKAPEDKARYFVASKVSGKGNLREGPGLKHKIVGEIREGERYLVIEQITNPGERSPWYKIRLENGTEAWIAGSLGEVQQ